MCPEQTGSHQSRARVGRGTHQIQIREPTIRCGHQKNVHPCMSNEVEVLEGGVSKDAVFGRKVCGDDVRVVHEVARPDQVRKDSVRVRLRPRDNRLSASAILTSSPLNFLNIRVSKILTPNIYQRALRYAERNSVALTK